MKGGERLGPMDSAIYFSFALRFCSEKKKKKKVILYSSIGSIFFSPLIRDVKGIHLFVFFFF